MKVCLFTIVLCVFFSTNSMASSAAVIPLMVEDNQSIPTSKIVSLRAIIEKYDNNDSPMLSVSETGAQSSSIYIVPQGYRFVVNTINFVAIDKYTYCIVKIGNSGVRNVLIHSNLMSDNHNYTIVLSPGFVVAPNSGLFLNGSGCSAYVNGYLTDN